MEPSAFEEQPPQSGDWLTGAARAGGRYPYRHKTPWRHNLIGIVVLAAVDRDRESP